MTDPTPPADAYSGLLASARRARQNGDLAGARALLRAITARYPADARAWLLLATVAQTRTEQHHAFVQALAADPANKLAQRGLAAMRQADAAPVATPTLPPSHGAATPLKAAPPPTEAEQAQRIRWPLYALLATAVVICLVFAAIVTRPRTDTAVLPPLAPVGPILASPLPTVGVQLVATLPAAPAATASAAPEPTVEPISTSAAASQPTSVLLPPTEAVAFGQIIGDGVWNIGLLRPQDTIVLTGSIGELQPQGRFVLALLAVSHSANGERQLPARLLALVDADGQRFSPLPAASTAYMQAYGSNQVGVVSMETPIPANLGIVSIPVIFDVPASARGLKLLVGNVGGWPIGGG